MKRLLLILILTVNFQSWTKADDISDFEIEGMSIGDSALKYFSEKELSNKDDTIYYIAGQGAYIDKIVERGPAHNLLQPNDIILKVDGKAFKTKLFAVELVKRKPNTKIVFTVVRDEYIIDVELILGEK